MIERLKLAIRNIPDFPKPGIAFKDITPILKDPNLCSDIVTEFYQQLIGKVRIDAIVGTESRGFFFGFLLANRMGIPFIPLRKAGKLPYHTISHEYDLEYGKAKVEMHADALEKGWNVLIHDDLLATGGTAEASSILVQKLGAKVAGFIFVIDVGLNGEEKLKQYSPEVISLIKY